MNNINIDIITNYFCNFNCEYCFLHKLKNIKQVIDISKLQLQLEEVSNKYSIDGINIYGGEVSLLPMEYLKQLIGLCSKYAQVNVITNFSNYECNNFLGQEDVTISTSINEERNYNQEIEYAILSSDISNISLIQVVTPSLLKNTAKEVLTHLELFKKSVGFLPYSPAKNAGVNYEITNMEFAIFMKEIIYEYTSGNYSFNISNIDQLNDVIEKKYNPKMESILFINPFNEYASVSYDNNLEYFRIFQTIDDWESACNKETIDYKKICSKCKYYGRCYAEHIKEWRKGDECCGMKSLVEWYEKNIYKNNRDMSASM